MTVFDLGDISTSWPAAADIPDLPPVRPLGPIPGSGDRPAPTVAPWLDVLPVAVDPALVDYQPPTLDDLGLAGDPVAVVLRMRTQIDALVAGMTDQQRADLAQYEQPTRPNLRSVA